MSRKQFHSDGTALLRSLVTFQLLLTTYTTPPLATETPPSIPSLPWLSSISPSFCLLRNPSLWVSVQRKSEENYKHPRKNIPGTASSTTHTLVCPPARIAWHRSILFTLHLSIWGSSPNFLIRDGSHCLLPSWNSLWVLSSWKSQGCWANLLWRCRIPAPSMGRSEWLILSSLHRKRCFKALSWK